MGNITRFQVDKLFGYQNYAFEIEDDTIVIVGENGTGKTTILRLFYYFITGQWGSLAKYQFDKLSVTINKSKFDITYNLLESNIRRIDRKFLRRLPIHARVEVRNLVEHGELNQVLPEIERICEKYHIPFHLALRFIEQYEEGEPIKKIKERESLLKEVRSLDVQFLYLPTYRRIEQDLGVIMRGLNVDDLRNRYLTPSPRQRNPLYVELIEFGMSDVVESINNTLEELKEFDRENLTELTLGYLSDVIERQYNEVRISTIQDTSDLTINEIMNRIQKDLLSETNKKHLWDTINKVKRGEDPNEHERLICHYFIKLLKFHEELKTKESRIISFCEVCNEYMVNKQLVYNSANFQFQIQRTDLDEHFYEVDLRQLSSGEKQIVSLFNHLYLSGAENYFVLIDEPELSLSVMWQKKFLADIQKSSFCTGLLAVTHSPFIYDNELKRYTHGLGEFLH